MLHSVCPVQHGGACDGHKTRNVALMPTLQARVRETLHTHIVYSASVSALEVTPENSVWRHFMCLSKASQSHPGSVLAASTPWA